MNKLLLRFTGMCAFVPKHEKGDRNRARVLLAEMDEGGQHRAGNAGHVEPHYPVLVAFNDTFTSCKPTGKNTHGQVDQEHACVRQDVTFNKGRDQEMGLIYLQGQDLRIRDALDNRLKIFRQIEKDSCHSRAFSWVAPMARINNPVSQEEANAEWAQVEDRALGRERVPKYIAARMELTEGTLTNYAFAADSERLIVKWAFRRGDEDFPIKEVRPISEEVQLEYIFDGDEVCFELEDNIHGRVRNRQTSFFALKPRVGYNIVEAWIANVPLRQVLERDYTAGAPINLWMEEVATRTRGIGSVEGDRNVEHHFRHYYRLLRSGRTLRLPHPHGRWRGPGGPSIESPRCPPVVLSANERA